MLLASLIGAAALAAFITILYVKRKPEAVGTESSKLMKVLLPAGMFLAGRIPEGRSQKDRQIRQKLWQIQGQSEEETDRAVLWYRAKRWSLILGTLLICLLLFSAEQMAERMENKGTALIFKRPVYGEGDQKESLRMAIDGASRHVTVTVPEQEINDEQAKEAVEDALKEVRSQWDGKVISKDLSLPSSLNGVSLEWRSLTPALMDSSGHLRTEADDKRQEVRFLADASVKEQKESVLVTMQIASRQELSAIEQIDLIVNGLKDGAYTDPLQVVLPQTTEDGREILWQKDKGVSPVWWLLLLLLLPLSAVLKQDQDLNHSVRQRKSRMQAEYPEMISELVILMGSGLPFAAAWQRLAGDYQKQKAVDKIERPLYEEVKRSSGLLQSGMTLKEALDDFALRVPVKEIRRFTTLMIQNQKRGDQFLLVRLNELSNEVTQARKKQIQEQSEQADTKLLLPMTIMLIVVILIVMTPALMTMQL